MAIGDSGGASVRLREVDPPVADDVRHFDQLSHREQRAFLRLYRGADPAAVPLATGQVVVFTSYYRVER